MPLNRKNILADCCHISCSWYSRTKAMHRTVMHKATKISVNFHIGSFTGGWPWPVASGSETFVESCDISPFGTMTIPSAFSTFSLESAIKAEGRRAVLQPVNTDVSL